MSDIPDIYIKRFTIQKGEINYFINGDNVEVISKV